MDVNNAVLKSLLASSNLILFSFFSMMMWMDSETSVGKGGHFMASTKCLYEHLLDACAEI